MGRDAQWFNGFHQRLTPTAEMQRRITSGVSHLRNYCAGHEVIAEGLEQDLFLQGSYPQNTLARPVASTYDVDITLPLTVDFCSSLGNDSRRIMAAVEACLREDPFYDEVLQSKTRCLRLEYAGEFHIDVVPMTPSGDARAPWVVANGNGGWQKTNPQELKAWVTDINAQCSGRFVRTVKFLKRWREIQLGPEFAGRSVFITAFAGTHNPFAPELRHTAMAYRGQHAMDDADFFLSTARTMADCMRKWGTGFYLDNPVLPGENLAAGMSYDDMRRMRHELERLAVTAADAFKEPDNDRALEKWQEVLGDDFGP